MLYDHLIILFHIPRIKQFPLKCFPNNLKNSEENCKLTIAIIVNFGND